VESKEAETLTAKYILIATGSKVAMLPDVKVDGKVVGTVTSSAYSPGTGTSIGLGFVHRSVEPPANAIVRRSDAGSGEAGELAVEIRALPLVELPTGFGDGQPPT
jgi:glycine cleavage system aminomethyltransferase T